MPRTICALVALALVLNGCAHPPLTCEPTRTLYIVSQGWHRGIVVERGDLVKRLPALAGDIGHEGHVEIGWGEERFYQARHATAGMALRAILWPNASVLHVVPFADAPRRYFPQSEIVEVRTDEAGYEAALAFMVASFTRTPERGVVRLGRSRYGEGWFYRAEGSFHLFNTCNSWVAGAIAKAGSRCGPP